jgi:hypothetical protein
VIPAILPSTVDSKTWLWVIEKRKTLHQKGLRGCFIIGRISRAIMENKKGSELPFNY